MPGNQPVQQSMNVWKIQRASKKHLIPPQLPQFLCENVQVSDILVKAQTSQFMVSQSLFWLLEGWKHLGQDMKYDMKYQIFLQMSAKVKLRLFGAQHVTFYFSVPLLVIYSHFWIIARNG